MDRQFALELVARDIQKLERQKDVGANTLAILLLAKVIIALFGEEQ